MSRPPVTLITGAQGEIGRAVQRSVLSSGGGVVAVDLMTGTPERNVESLAFDVADERGWNTVLPHLEGRKVVGLVTVAALNRTGRLEDYSVADWDAMMAVNVRGVFLAMRTVIPFFRQSGEGTVVNLSSVSAFIGAVGGAAYHSTKGAIISLSRALAEELAPDGVRVNSVCPGWVDTKFTAAYLDAQADPVAAR